MNPRSPNEMILMERDKQLLLSLFENKIMNRDHINKYIFGEVHKSTVNKRLKRLCDHGLINSFPLNYKGKTIYGYSLTVKGFKSVRHSLPYEGGKPSKSECPYHDAGLVDIRQIFEHKESVKNYYTENVLQTCSEFQEDEIFESFIELNSDSVAAIETKVGILHLAVEFEASKKSPNRYMNKLHEYYIKRNIQGVLYICDDTYILNSLLSADKEVSQRHQSSSKVFTALIDDVITTKGALKFKNVEKYIFTVS